MGMCDNCYGCSSSLQVGLTGYDIVRIAAAGTGTWRFTAMCEAVGDATFSFRCRGRKMKFVLAQKRGRCVFFNRKSRLGCSIQQAKPWVCLLYPFSRDGRLLFDVRCPVRSLRAAEKQGLPNGFLEAYLWEAAAYGEIVGDWNASARGTEPHEDFFKFAVSEMQLESTPWGSAWRRLLRVFRKR